MVGVEQFLYLSDLFDFYGALLTQKQQECLHLHLYDDLSLSEIGEELGISRQAAYDNIHRAARTMQSYEKRLRLVARCQEELKILGRICQELKQIQTPENSRQIASMLTALVPFLGREEVQN